MSNGATTSIRMKDFGETLGTRGLGTRVRERIVSILRSSPDRIVLDFGGVQVMTQSFGDELFRKLVGEVSSEEVRRVGVTGVSEDVRAVLRYSVSRAEQAADRP